MFVKIVCKPIVFRWAYEINERSLEGAKMAPSQWASRYVVRGRGPGQYRPDCGPYLEEDLPKALWGFRHLNDLHVSVSFGILTRSENDEARLAVKDSKFGIFVLDEFDSYLSVAAPRFDFDALRDILLRGRPMEVNATVFWKDKQTYHLSDFSLFEAEDE